MKTPKVVLRIDTSGAYGQGIVRGISKYSQQFGKWYISQNLTYFDATGHNFDPDRPDNWIADGIIVDSAKFPEMLKQHRIPIIAFDNYKAIHDMPEIKADRQAIAEIALKHFVARNFSQLAFCGFYGMNWVVNQKIYFADCAGAKGLEVAKYELTAPEDGSLWEEELDKMGAWLNSLPHPLGLLACNDDCAKLVITACQLASIHVPDDIAILGVDSDDMVCLPLDPPLSSIVLDFETAGFEAASLLDRLMKGQEKSASQSIIIRPTHVKVRQSTDTFAVNDPEVRSALQYIRDHSDKNIGVPDVTESTCLSRRSLEYRFKAALGQSINKIIRAQRIVKVSEMLIETNLSISQIAYQLGFTSIEHISRYFSSEKGISPSEFRKKYGKA